MRRLKVKNALLWSYYPLVGIALAYTVKVVW